MTVCDNCAKIDCDSCHILDEDRSPEYRKKVQRFAVKEVFDIKIVDKYGNPICHSVPDKKEEPDWRKDYTEWREKNE